jgi:hypothetical protein
MHNKLILPQTQDTKLVPLISICNKEHRLTILNLLPDTHLFLVTTSTLFSNVPKKFVPAVCPIFGDVPVPAA